MSGDECFPEGAVHFGQSAVLLLTVPPCPAIRNSGARAAMPCDAGATMIDSLIYTYKERAEDVKRDEKRKRDA